MLCDFKRVNKHVVECKMCSRVVYTTMENVVAECKEPSFGISRFIPKASSCCPEKNVQNNLESRVDGPPEKD